MYCTRKGGLGLLIVVVARFFSSALASKGVKHVVMFSFKEGVSKNDITRIKKGLLDLPKQIPCIKSYELGCDLMLPAGQNHPAGKNRLLSWTACFESVKEYQVYEEHEAHKAFLGKLKEVVLPGSRAAIQYEIEHHTSE